MKRFWTLRRKLILFSLALISIPLAGISLLQQIERILVENLQQHLQGYAQSIAFSLTQQKALFSRDVLGSEASQSGFYVSTLPQPLDIDGYHDDWFAVSDFTKRYRNESLSLSVMTGTRGDSFSLMIDVEVPSIGYRQTHDLDALSDQVVVRLINQKGEHYELKFAPLAPGKVNPSIRSDAQQNVWVSDAKWQETNTGYGLEIKLPIFQQWQALGVAVFHPDGQSSTVQTVSSFEQQLNPLIWPSQALEAQLKQLNSRNARRIWVLDAKGRLLARAGNVKSDLPLQRVNPIINFLFAPPPGDFNDPRARSIALSMPAVQQALNGQSQLDLEPVAGQTLAIALASVPVIADGAVIGVVVVEETVAAIQMVQREALNVFVNTSLLMILMVIVVAIVIATRFTHRITRLNQSVNESVDEYGRVINIIDADKTKDEIGELGRSFESMSVRLTEYHDYLEKLASRLSHELRTPVAMVRSSIDNIALSHQEELSQPINNALSGIQRMSGIINRMKEAARVEQSIFASQRAEIDLKEFCHQYVDAYGQMNPDWSFEVILTGELNAIESSPELMAQLLDKLFSNAMDFAESSSVIRLYVEHNNDHIEVAVENRGPALPDVDTKELFASMVTLRDPKYRQPEQVNMGLGLYIVRLIAEYHGGDYFAYNTEDATGVRVGIRFSR